MGGGWARTVICGVAAKYRWVCQCCLPGQGGKGGRGWESEGQCEVGHKSTWERMEPEVYKKKQNRHLSKATYPGFVKASLLGGTVWRGRKHGRDTWWESLSVLSELRTRFAWVNKHAVILSRFHCWMLVHSKPQLYMHVYFLSLGWWFPQHVYDAVTCSRENGTLDTDTAPPHRLGWVECCSAIKQLTLHRPKQEQDEMFATELPVENDQNLCWLVLVRICHL